MKFKDYEYIRPDVEKMESDFEELLAKFRDAKSSDEQDHIIEEITKLRNNLDTMHTLVSIRHSINTLDEFYEQEQNFMDENSPRFMNMVTKFYKELIKTPFRKELENTRSEEHTSELQSRPHLVCRLLLEKKKKTRQVRIRCQ